MSDLKSELTDLASDLGEVGLDALLNEGLAKELPIIGSVVGIARVAQSVRDRIFLRDVVRFIREAEKSPRCEREAFLAKVNSDPKGKRRLQDSVDRFISQTDDESKVDIFAQLFRAVISGVIEQEIFIRLGLAIRQVYAPDLLVLASSQTGSSDDNAFLNSALAGLTIYRDIDRTKPQNKGLITPLWHLSPLGKAFVTAMKFEAQTTLEQTSSGSQN